MNILITRTVRPESDFVTLLSAKGHRVHGESLISFAPVEPGEVPRVEWLFFYSKTSVRFFFEQIDLGKIKDVRLAAIGQGTADFLERTYHQPEFVGTGDPFDTATAFLAVARGSQVLFPRAMDSRRTIQQLLGDKITAHDMVVYKNLARTDFDLPEFDCLVFTSPLNAQAYFSKRQFWPHQKVVAIGSTTASALAEFGVKKVTLADLPSEKSLALAVLNI